MKSGLAICLLLSNTRAMRINSRFIEDPDSGDAMVKEIAGKTHID